MMVLDTLRPGCDTLSLLHDLHTRTGKNWGTLLDPETTAEQLGLTNAELGHLRTVLRSILFRFQTLSLDSLRVYKKERALQELMSLPGTDLSMACTLLLRCLGHPTLPPTRDVRRVLTRMGALTIGLNDEELFERLQRIPLSVSISTLFDGLTALARRICKEKQPGCQECPVRKLCEHGRQTMKPEPVPGAMTFVDLFAGAGGLSLGLTQAGFVPVLAVEVDEWACETYRANHPCLPRKHVLAGDIRKIPPSMAEAILRGRRPDLLVGGPPCQGFSLIGKRGRSRTRFIDDPRNQLYKEFLHWVTYLQPRFVVMENVPGLYSYQEGAIRRDIESSFNEAGYAVDDLVVDASQFGVPQRRQRVLFVGAAVNDFGEKATKLVQRVTELLREHSAPEVPLKEAIGDLPPLEAGSGREATIVQRTVPLSAFAREMGAQCKQVLYHHVARPINLRDKLLYARLRPGETAEDAVKQGARHLMVYQNETYHDKYRRLRYDQPSPTIMSHLAKDGHMFIHPDPRQRRSITVREAARIQSFPDDFLFLGPRTAQFAQVGNAVPPKLARAIGAAILKAFSEVIG